MINLPANGHRAGKTTMVTAQTIASIQYWHGTIPYYMTRQQAQQAIRLNRELQLTTAERAFR